MLKKYLAKKAAKKSAGWLARKEAQIAVTAVATIATHKLIQKAAKKYPQLRFLKDKSRAA